MSITSSVSNTSAQTVSGPHGTEPEIDAKSLSLNLSPNLSRTEVRKQIRMARRSLSTEVQAEASFAACRRMLEKLSALKAQHVALYLSHDGELATAPLIEALWQQGIQTYLPRLHPFNVGQLLFLHYHADSPMQPNQFGIL
ncbi:MAG: 5-formyltetrahydrofolate cyclo-ligase, partial [Shewanella sp.]